MLVLTRKTGERIVIGTEIVVEVMGVVAGKVRLGITAPQQYAVHREEVYDRIVNGETPQLEKGGTSAESD